MFLSDANFENQLFCNLNRNVNQARSNKLKVSGIGIGAIWNYRDRAQEKCLGLDRDFMRRDWGRSVVV